MNRVKRFSFSFFAALLVMLLLSAGTVLAAEDGWFTEDGKTYYYDNVENVTGFREL